MLRQHVERAGAKRRRILRVFRDRIDRERQAADALVADAKTKLSEHVASGDITQAEADQKLAALTEGVTAMVNGEIPAGGLRFHDHGPDDDDSSSPSTTSATTSTA